MREGHEAADAREVERSVAPNDIRMPAAVDCDAVSSVEAASADPFAALTDGAILAFYIGPSGVVGGTKTDMVAWANDDVFLQIWIGADDKLPRRPAVRMPQCRRPISAS